MAPWQGDGTFLQETPVATGPTVWADTKAAGDVNITTADHDFHDQDLAQGIQESLNVNGLNKALADLNMNSFRLKALANPTAETDAVNAQTVQQGALTWAAVGGTGDAITLTLTPAATAQGAGSIVWFVATAANTTTTPTAQLNALTAMTIKNNGAALNVGDIQIGGIYALISTGSAWDILGVYRPSTDPWVVFAATTALRALAYTG